MRRAVPCDAEAFVAPVSIQYSRAALAIFWLKSQRCLWAIMACTSGATRAPARTRRRSGLGADGHAHTRHGVAGEPRSRTTQMQPLTLKEYSKEWTKRRPPQAPPHLRVRCSLGRRGSNLSGMLFLLLTSPCLDSGPSSVGTAARARRRDSPHSPWSATR